MTSLVVEAHKRRFTIKATPMQPLLAVVREVLGQLNLAGVDPAACSLFAGKKQLDLTCPVRLANLPAGCKLELITGHEPRLGVQETSAAPAPAAAAPAAPSQPAATAVCSAPLAAAPAPAATATTAAAQPVAPKPVPRETLQQSVPAATPAAAAAPALAAGPSSSKDPTPPEEAAPTAAAAAPAAQHPSVAIFGQEVLVFTREAELALESAHMALSDREPDDSFYEFTEGDLQKAMAGLARAKAQAEGGGVLMTKQMRAAEEARRAAAFGPVTVRAVLPDGHMLQATFQAAHPLSKLRGVVRRAVSEALGERLYLYTTPPKAVLKDLDASFFQAKLIPAARVHVGIQGQPVHPEGAPLLRPEVLALVAPPPDKASALHRGTSGEAAVGPGGDKRRNGDGGAGDAGPSGGGGSSGAAGGRPSGGAAGGSKAPKWLKLGAK